MSIGFVPSVGGNGNSTRSSRQRAVCALFPALPPSQRSAEDEFHDTAKTLRKKEEELNRPEKRLVVVEHGDKKLFAEVIDHVQERDLNWLRPCLLQEATNPTINIREFKGFEHESGRESMMHDLRGACDVLLPDMLAEDADPFTRTAVNLMLTSQGDSFMLNVEEAERRRANEALMRMMQELSDDNPEAFRAKQF
eukprot:Plantae.Rhodophyta-Purpureofilum_apyrenoidigerum.ctg19037.p1 GENE.Plantae.Rhodophyta-Purpureofilum_apyrenoidigerum.ctg19037~~Plantae.Rhodophyta-Purpureofilum_apyrenoidigerum.ctg19037.p1  ORF type:complete len:195 (-),score=44.58 Plantae.Rhodophyta-Purpureofilum_apyrenoidigerum.ctg19037:623-1207(-)